MRYIRCKKDNNNLKHSVFYAVHINGEILYPLSGLL